MSHDLPGPIPDMNRDGHIDSCDFALFLELTKAESGGPSRPRHSPGKQRTASRSAVNWPLLLASGGYFILLFTGVISLDAISAIAALFNVGCLIKALSP